MHVLKEQLIKQKGLKFSKKGDNMKAVNRRIKQDSTILLFNSDSFILKEISLLDLSGDVLFQKEVLAFQSKNFFFVKFPEIKSKNELLLFVTTSSGSFSHLIKLPTKTVKL